MTAQIENATDGRRLVKVTFTPESANPARQYDIQVIFQVKRSDAAHIEGEPFAIIGPLSVTRTDTNESVPLTFEQMDAVTDAALERACEDAGLGWT